MALVNLVCKVSEVNGVETWVFRHESAELGVRRTEMPFQAEAGVTTRLKWWMIGNPGGSIKVEVFQGDRLIAKRLRSAIPNTKPAGFDSIPIKPE
ncbi:MAG: hypothetical protein WAT18_12085 [Sphingorhabdus sp.]|jgi:hypothetical protein|uniref:hypothetical protein n=1 Tax=Sphingorhabdus sp. TaxID=1902408 RepID=UPI003BB0F578|nr:hypothetical protein [Sphingomonadales bacterium]MBL0021463.1 hypothetical protein [Sphingomonadales bacterium]